uniref:Uncharacterized protein n=1 Tax=Sciurus vulgaris TaxID=55149 RepID=A0A8D2DY31_SCIVU
MMPSPFSRKMPRVSTSLPLEAELVLNFILSLVGRPEIVSCRFNCVASPKFRTTIKTLSMPSSSLVYTRGWLSFLTRQNQPLLRSNSLEWSRLKS